MSTFGAVLAGARVPLHDLNDADRVLRQLTPAQARRVWASIVKELGTDSARLTERVQSLRQPKTPADWIMGTTTHWVAVIRGKNARTNLVAGGGRVHRYKYRITVEEVYEKLLSRLSTFIAEAT